MSVAGEMTVEPEKLLWMAVFEQAIKDTKALIRKAGAKPGVWSSPLFRGEVDVLKRWFRSKATHPGSFVFLCDLMDIHPEQALGSIEKRYLQFLTPVAEPDNHQPNDEDKETK